MSRGHLRTTAIRILWGACLVGAAAVPPLLEARGEAAVKSAWACADAARPCGELGTVDLHARGVSIADAWREQGGFRIDAESIEVGLVEGELDVRVRGVALARAPVRPAPARAPDPTREVASVSTNAPRRSVPSTHGLPVRLALEDTVEIDGPRGSVLAIEAARARLDGDGGLEIDARIAVRHEALPSVPTMRAHALALEGDLSRWHAEADVVLAHGDAPLHVEADLDGEPPRFVASSGDGAVTIRPLRSRGVLLAADRFPLAPLLGVLPRSALPDGVRAEDARVSGTIEAHLGDGPRMHLTDVEVDGLVIDDARLARQPVDVGALQIAGDVGLARGGGFADVVLAHDGAELGVSAALSPDRIALSLELPEHECQTVLDALPGAMKDTLGGMRLRGRVAGHLRLSIDREALADARGSYGGEPGEVPPQPGELDLSLPILQACTVVADPSAIDLGALLGPYRHRFSTASGEARTRTLAPGAPLFAPLSTVRLVADAFVTLEDRRFWGHDGFDREQMANALWHNVVRGGVHRGASTISQQATRNLWLGVDRSLARKLQEALLTSRLEAEVPKDRILELYLNVIELGPDVHGVEAAAKWWFDKPASELDVREAVHLAALAPAPRRYAQRFASGEVDAEWNDMLDRQIRRMWLAGRISAADRDRALRSKLRLVAH